MARLVRLVVVKFERSNDGQFGLGADGSLPRVEHVRTLSKDGTPIGDLYAAHVEARASIRDGLLTVDAEALEQAESLLEVGAKAVSLARRQGVSCSSPIPFVGLDLASERGPVPDVIDSEYSPVRHVISSAHEFPLDRPDIWDRLLRRA